MENLTQQQIEELIQFIDEAEEPATITNTIVAAVLAFLAVKIAGTATAQALLEEIVARQTTDTNLSTAINQLQQLIQSLGSVVYFDSMGELDGDVDIHVDTGMVVYDPENDIIKKYTSPSQYEPVSCDAKLLYCNKVTGYFYRYSTRSGMVQVGGGDGISEDDIINDLTTGGRNKALSAEMGKQIKEEIDNLGIEGIVSVDDADLEFIDEDGNIAMRVAEGHIETAGFDSRQVATNTNAIQQLQQQIGQAGGNVQTDVVVMEDSEAAFDVSDESGNVVLRVGSDGHIETKGFNSNEVSGTDIFRLTKMTPNCIFHANAAVNGILGNTIASIREAYKKGYRWFEIDSKPCRDNGAILTHEAGQYINQSGTPYTIYQKSDPTQTPIEVGTFAGYDSTDLAENYTWTASTYTDGVLTAEGKPMETLEQAIWHICHIRRCPLEVDRQTLTKAVQLKAFQYAKSLGVEHYLFFEAGSAGNVSGFSDWDEMPSILCSLGTTGYATDIVNVARDYKTPRNNIIFSYSSTAPKDDTTLKAVADAAHAVGCFALTWSYNTNDIDELRRWLRAGFDFALTNGTIVNTDI